MLLRALFMLLVWVGLSQAEEKVRVVSFSTVLTEIATRVGGDRVSVLGLVKPGADPHEYQPNPEDLKQVGDAQLILLSAKHMESYIGKLQESTGTRGAVIEVGDQFPSLRMAPEKEKPESTAAEDPHWWHSLQNMRRATKVVQDELTKAAPGAAAEFATRAAVYLRELDELERWTRVQIARVPRNQRKLVTSHDAFQYFAREYGFTVYPIEGISTDEQPSARQVAELIDKIRQEKVKAVFLEDKANPKVSTEITRESGARIGGTLYADGLTEGDGATYAGMFRHNVSTIVNGLLGRE